MVMKKLRALIFLMAAAGSANSQNFLPGWIIDNSRDTVRGFIDYRQWDKSPLTISFRENENTQKLEYRPSDISGFYVKNEYYESATIDVDTSPQTLSKLDRSRAPNFIRDRVFLQILISGEKSLALYTDQLEKANFYIQQDNTYQPLVYKKYISNPDKQQVGENTEYKGTLNIYLRDCADITSRLSHVTYTLNSLVRLFRGYYECTGKSVNLVNERNAAAFEFGITAGASLSSVYFDQGTVYNSYLQAANTANSAAPVFGVYFDFNLLRARGLRISNDLIFTFLDIRKTTPQANLSFNYTYLKTHSMLQLNILKSGSLYISGGFSVAVALNSTTTTQENLGFGYSNRDFSKSTFELGYLGGIGGRFGRFNLETRYERSSGISNYLGSYSERFYLLLRYSLKK